MAGSHIPSDLPSAPALACLRCGTDDVRQAHRTRGDTALKASLLTAGGALVVTSVLAGWAPLLISFVLIAAGAFVPPTRVLGHRYRCVRCGERWQD